MKIYSISQQQNVNHKGFQNKTIPQLAKNNYKEFNSKEIIGKITKLGEKTEKSTYQIMPAQNQIAENLKGLMEVVVDKSKALIERIKIFSNENPKLCLTDIEYTYNKKGQIIRVNKKTLSPNKKENHIKSNLKYEDNAVIIDKDINDGTKKTRTIISNKDSKNFILKSTRNYKDKTTEKLIYKEDENLTFTIRHKKNNTKEYSAYGDPQTGELIFSKNTFSPMNMGEYTELQGDGNYIRQIEFDDGTIKTRISKAKPSDSFQRQKIDLITPEQEMLSILEEYGVK